jgi:hypothetical protein
MVNIGLQTRVNPRRRITPNGQLDDVRRKSVALDEDRLHGHSFSGGRIRPETENA